jgi:integrase
VDYLRKTSDGYYEVRIAVPARLRPILKQSNLTQRLGTKNKAYAKQIASMHVSKLRQRITEAELGRTTPPQAVDVMEAVRAIDRWTAAERQRVLPQAFATGAVVPLGVSFGWKDCWRSVEGGQAPARIMVDPQDAALLAALHAQGFSFPPGTSIPSSIRSEFARTCGRLEHEVEITRGGSREYLDRTGALSTTVNSVGAGALPIISAAFAGWKEKREVGGKAAGKSAREFETQIKRFIDVSGDISMSAVTKQHCIDFRDLMSRYPARPTKEQKRTPIRELIATLKESRVMYAPLTPKTLNDTVFAAVKAVFADVLKSRGLSNPMAGIAVADPSSNEPSRLPYSGDDLSRLLAAAPFRGQLTQDDRAAGEAQKWLPLLCAFTGARLEELAQLAVTDIKVEETIHFIHFQERYSGVDPGFKRSLKNASSHRRVPIHSALIGLGFLDFVEQQRNNMHVHLFPQMKWDEPKKNDKTYKVSQRFTNWWSEYSRTIVPDPQKSFHSFRHTVTERLRNAGVEEALNDALTGHATPGQGAKYGRKRNGARYSMTVLASAIEKLTYPEVDLSAIG